MVCGCHIHVGVTGHAQALALANHMRPWLPALQAIAARGPHEATPPAGTRRQARAEGGRLVLRQGPLGDTC
ncbi:glutamate-cysteine ligase family protein [Streptomyces sp. NPDC090036]|uniref:glutamate-cysteine ligase family protein n=1 Tax=Streptomyces sp. NPDC090036 TaxID=3365926 RepID=UPI0037FD8400